MKWDYKILIILTIISLSSCSPQRRLNRLIRKHPELVTTDTIKINDTTILPEVKIDTVFHYSHLNDTITIEKEKLKMKLHKINDTIYIEAKQERDTIIITKQIPVEKVIYKEQESFLKKTWRIFKYRIVGGLFFLLLILVALWLKKEVK